MNRRRTATWVGLVALAIGLAVGFFEVLERRFIEGGIYPHYASFRSDPLGASALFETLERHPDFEVHRNLTHLNQVKGLDPDTTILLLGFPRDAISDLRAPADSPVMKAVEEGARLVITINPELVPEKFRPIKSKEEEDWFERRRKLREKQNREKFSPGEKEIDDDGKAQESEKADSETAAESEAKIFTTVGPPLTLKLGFQIASVDAFERPEEGWMPKAGKQFKKANPAFPFPDWYSQYRFEKPDKPWKIVGTVKNKPVVIERKFGKGTVVLATDSFFVSNEALHHNAVPEFLIWMLGGKSRIVIDETIHGTEEAGGAMKMIRRYRLHGIFFGLLIFVGLWAWRSASSLAPGSDDLDRGLVGGGEAVAGKETGSGLIQLLKKSVPTKDILGQCVEVWRRSSITKSPLSQTNEIEGIVSRHESDFRHFGVVEAYRDIVNVLRKR